LDDLIVSGFREIISIDKRKVQKAKQEAPFKNKPNEKVLACPKEGFEWRICLGVCPIAESFANFC
jgi:hypothetical protein